MIKRIRLQDAEPAVPDVAGPLRTAVWRFLDGPGDLAPATWALVEWWPDGTAPAVLTGGSADPDPAVTVAAEVVVRGADWLERRWAEGGTHLKHVALATRAEGLSREEFSERWRSHAGTVQGRGGATVTIPDAVRGNAYVQNHPLVPGSWDAVTEVWVGDAAALAARIAWLQTTRSGSDGLFGRTLQLAVEEHPAVT